MANFTRVLYNETSRNSADHDTDDDGLIEISNAAQLGAILYDVDGDGRIGNDESRALYEAAFLGANAADGMGCPATGCTGYELIADLNLALPPYGEPPFWWPIGGDSSGWYNAIFEGNGHTISGLRINARRDQVGLFAVLAGNGVIRNLGLIAPQVSAPGYPNNGPAVGALVGTNKGTITSVFVQGGTVTTNNPGTGTKYVWIGGLAGGNRDNNSASISDSYSTAAVSSTAGAFNAIGGLVGSLHKGTINDVYAAGPVSNASGNPPNSSGGLVGGNISANTPYGYYDMEVSGRSDGNKGAGRTTEQLQSGTGPTDLVWRGWSTDTWRFSPGLYPKLSFERPIAVENFTATAGPGSLTLVWAETLDTSVTGHQYSTDGGATWQDLDAPRPYHYQGSKLPNGRNANSQFISGLTAGTEYTVLVRAVNSNGATPAAALTVTPVATVGVCSRTAEVQTALLTATGQSACANVTAAHLEMVTALDVSSQSITALAAGDFDGLSNLVSLSIAGNPIAEVNSETTLPAGIFRGLHNLEMIDMSGLGLTTLPDGIFQGLSRLWLLNLTSNKLTALRTLYLTNNQLATVDAAAFAGIPDLTGLDLNRNSTLTTLPDGVFDSLRELRLLNLANNSLTTLEATTFDGLTNLTSLNLAGNQITTLPTGVFGMMPDLATLSLAGNRLGSLSGNTFLKQTELMELDLSGNSLIVLPPNPFNGATKIERLDLSNSGVGGNNTILPANSFNRMTNLRELYLHDNHLTSLHGDLFSDSKLSTVRTLTLNGNALTGMTATTFNGLTGLRVLDLGGNAITALPANAFTGPSSLEALGLNDNSLSALSANAFSKVPKLEFLTLKGNTISSLNADAFDGLSSLYSLNLSGNSFTTLPANLLSDVTGLEFLLMADGGLTSVGTDPFDGLTALSVIDLSENDLPANALTTAMFEDMTYLQMLSTSGNAGHPFTLTLPGSATVAAIPDRYDTNASIFWR